MPQFWPIGIVLVALSACVTLIMLMRIIANWRRERPVIADLINKEGQSLVVLVHGTRRTTEYLDGMRAILGEVRPKLTFSQFSILPEAFLMRTLSLSRSRSVRKFTSSTVGRSTVRLFW